MPYQQTREQSAEIFRQVIPLMVRHEAGCHPLSYQLWYEYVGGLNTNLARFLDERLKTSALLSDMEVRRLHSRHIAARDALATEEIQQEFGDLLEGAVQAATQAKEGVLRFEHSLEDRSRRLEQVTAGAETQSIVHELIGDARATLKLMQQLCDALEAQERQATRLRDRLQQTHNESMTDALSGLRNRRGFERAIEELCESGNALEGAALIIADVDHFKAINDTHGHLVGDKVIHAVADILRASIKGRDLAVRLGGEEFAIYLPHTSLAGAVALAEQVRTRIMELRIRRADMVEPVGTVTISLGVATGQASETLDLLMNRADHALYEAKRAGRNRVCTSESGSARPPGSVDEGLHAGLCSGHIGGRSRYGKV